MNMIEKVAKEIALADGSQMTMEIYNHLAKAAIEAMREPTEEMKNVETGSIYYTQVELWHSFIDAALKED